MGIANKIKDVFHHDSPNTTSSATSTTHTNVTTQTPNPRMDSDRDESRTLDDNRKMGEERDTVGSDFPSSHTTNGHGGISSDVLGTGVHNGVTGVGSERPLDRHDSTLDRDRTDYEPVNPLPHNEPGGPIGSSEDYTTSSVGRDGASELAGRNQEYERAAGMTGRD